jgi:hypothetical protein
MGNPDTLDILGTQGTGRKKRAKNTTNHRKLKRCATWTPLKQKHGMNPGAHEWQGVSVL